MPRYFRLKQIIGDRNAGIEPLIPVSRSHWYQGIKNGVYPAPIRLSVRISVWREEDIMELLERLAA